MNTITAETDQPVPPGEGEMDPYQRAALEADERRKEEERIAKIEAMAQSLAAKRKAAIEYRQASGIEQIWLEDEDAYDGIDDANRAQEGAQGSRHRYTKAETSSGTYTKTVADTGNSCILLPNITGPYVDSAAASIADMLLPMDDWPFGIATTPIPELAAIVEQVDQMDLPDQQPVQVPGMAGPVAAGQIRSNAEKETERAKKCAEKAETRIKDWLTECQWHGKSRRQIDDAARVGTGIVKGPIPELKKHYRWSDKDGVQTLEIHEETKPVTKNVDYWNLFPDPACGENIHNGSFIWERDEITKKTLSDLRGQPGYLDSQIEQCLAEGPQTPEFNAGTIDTKNGDDAQYEVWYFHGVIERADAEAAGCDCSVHGDEYIAVPAVITVVNGRPIRAALNHMDKGSFPYDILTWKRRPGMPWGQGMGRQIRPAQRALTACFRALMENAGLSAKPMLAVLRKYLAPADGTWELYGGKVFEVADDADMTDAKSAIATIDIHSRQQELLAIIQFAKNLAEDITNQPMLLQGQQGKAPDTVGGMTILNNNASVVKRRIARQFDDQVIEPSITRYYDYLMQYGEDEEEKGLFIIDARASSVLVERDIQNKNMIQLLGASLNPAYGVDPKKAFAETSLAMKIDPKRLQYTDEEWKRIQDNAQKQPPDPRIQAAEIREKGQSEREQMRLAFEAEQADLDRQLQSAELSSEERRHIEDKKVLLASLALRLRTQKELSPRADALPPPTEPAGRAPAGQAFAQ